MYEIKFLCTFYENSYISSLFSIFCFPMLKQRDYSCSVVKTITVYYILWIIGNVIFIFDIIIIITLSVSLYWLFSGLKKKKEILVVSDEVVLFYFLISKRMTSEVNHNLKNIASYSSRTYSKKICFQNLLSPFF